jgi:hypothetical protein
MDKILNYEVKCELCKKTYNFIFDRKYYLFENRKKKCVCKQCMEKESEGKIWFTDYIPAFVSGGNIETHIFKHKKSLNDFIKRKTPQGYKAICTDKTIIDVGKEGSYVRGFVSEYINLVNKNEINNTI